MDEERQSQIRKLMIQSEHLLVYATKRWRRYQAYRRHPWMRFLLPFDYFWLMMAGPILEREIKFHIEAHEVLERMLDDSVRQAAGAGAE